jgi:hypothetical protein
MTKKQNPFFDTPYAAYAPPQPIGRALKASKKFIFNILTLKR